MGSCSRRPRWRSVTLVTIWSLGPSVPANDGLVHFTQVSVEHHDDHRPSRNCDVELWVKNESVPACQRPARDCDVGTYTSSIEIGGIQLGIDRTSFVETLLKG